ncbi:hypothetical protein BY458DRAFT_524167 [Sporodiniella umbellata]|nr:hypothetical protein BY458DRAFT_524167 [Sporodiniella umbellata]
MDFKASTQYDDLLTHLFLDNLHLWFTTTKTNQLYRTPRIRNTKILAIVRKHVLERSRTTEAVDELLEMDYFKHYLSCKTSKQTQDFIQLMERYLCMYMPNAGYELSETTRYSERKTEACMLATRDWCRGDEIVYLTGLADFEHGVLGPARFVNHDCEANCKFVMYEENSILLQVRREIRCGEEITVYYGDHYFGERNCECKCSTCEKGERKRKATMIEADMSERKKQRVMSIDFICNPLLNLLDLEKTIVVHSSELYSPPLSTKADSAVALSPGSPEKEKDDLLDRFLDDISDLSSVTSFLSDSSLSLPKKKKKPSALDCIACHSPLASIPGGSGELATWAWSPSAVFTDWSPKRCPRCERHFAIFEWEWPERKSELQRKKNV